MVYPPKLVPIASNGESPSADRRLPFEISPAQRPLVHAVLDWLPYPALYIDRDGWIRMANDAFAQALGVGREHLVDALAANTPLALQGDQIIACIEGQSSVLHVVPDQRDPFVLDALAQRNEFGVVQGCLFVRNVDRTSAVNVLDALASVESADDAELDVQDSISELRRAMNSIDTPIALIGADE